MRQDHPVRRAGAHPGARRVVVVGGGIAGLQTALTVRRSDPGCEVALLTKADLAESNTRYAQGGMAAVVPRPPGAGYDGTTEGAESDSVEAHIADTLAAGAGLADQHAVTVLCHGAADGIRRLQEAGVAFDPASGTAALALGREAAHSAARILHIRGDATGAGLLDVLVAAVRRDQGIRVLENAVVTRVLLDGRPGGTPRATGVELLRNGEVQQVGADAVVLATGGAGQLFEHTTNPAIATGDGVALAWRAGAVVADLEFFQFHPTSLDVPGNPLVSEAVRGEGARLVDVRGRAFKGDYHPDGDLAPRDVVSRSIARHRVASMRTATDTASDTASDTATDADADRREDTAGASASRVWLDATSLGKAFLANRFPFLTALTDRYGFDWSSSPVPVVPAAHYWMGGVRTDTHGRTSVPGLFAVGEVACTGVHGANRLASNSLLEGIVFGARCATAIVDGGGGAPLFDAALLDLEAESTATQDFTRADLQSLMSDHAGVLRMADGLDLARKHLAAYRPGSDPEAANLLLCARLLVHAAAGRTESCGAHYRSDQPDDASRPAPSRSYVRAQGATP